MPCKYHHHLYAKRHEVGKALVGGGGAKSLEMVEGRGERGTNRQYGCDLEDVRAQAVGTSYSPSVNGSQPGMVLFLQ